MEESSSSSNSSYATGFSSTPKQMEHQQTMAKEDHDFQLKLQMAQHDQEAKMKNKELGWIGFLFGTAENASKNIAALISLILFVGLFSSVEGLPNAICEAMKLGKPIIFSRVSDFDVLVCNNGILCDGNNPESIRDALIKALSLSTSEMLEMGEKSRLLSEKLFGEDNIICKWESLINS